MGVCRSRKGPIFAVACHVIMVSGCQRYWVIDPSPPTNRKKLLSSVARALSKTRTKNTVKHVVVSVKDVLSFSMRERGIESFYFNGTFMPSRSNTSTLQCFPNDKPRAKKKPLKKPIMKLAGCWCFDAIFADYCGKVQRQLTNQSFRHPVLCVEMQTLG